MKTPQEKLKIYLMEGPEEIKRDFEDAKDTVSDLFYNPPAREIYMREVKKEVKRTWKDMKHNWSR